MQEGSVLCIKSPHKVLPGWPNVQAKLENQKIHKTYIVTVSYRNKE